MSQAAQTHTVISGLITAQATFGQNSVTFLGPLTFDEEIVLAEMTCEVQVDPDDHRAVAYALTDIYSAEYDAWCDRLRAARTEAGSAPSRVRGPQTPVHRPCPTLWAGR